MGKYADYFDEFLGALDDYTAEMRMLYSVRGLETQTEAERNTVIQSKIKVLQVFNTVLTELQKTNEKNV